jgi:hypothetical protein
MENFGKNVHEFCPKCFFMVMKTIVANFSQIPFEVYR